MLTATSIELRAGARVLMDDVTFRIAPGDRVGLVGRNGAGKTTLTRALAGEVEPAAGSSPARGPWATCRRTRVRGISTSWPVIASWRPGVWTTWSGACATTEGEMASADTEHARARHAPLHAAGGGVPGPGRVRRRGRGGGHRLSLGLAERVLDQPLGTLSGGQRRRVELARILFSGAETLLLDEPTNHLDADSIVWLRDFLKAHKGGLVVISHDVGLLEHCVNRVLHLDANRAELDIYNVSWKTYLPSASRTSGAASGSGPTRRSRPQR